MIDLKDIDFISKIQEIEDRDLSDLVNTLVGDLKTMYNQIKHIQEVGSDSKLLEELAQNLIQSTPTQIATIDSLTVLLQQNAYELVQYQALLHYIGNNERVDELDELLAYTFKSLESLGNATPTTLYDLQVKEQANILEVMVKNG